MANDQLEPVTPRYGNPSEQSWRSLPTLDDAEAAPTALLAALPLNRNGNGFEVAFQVAGFTDYTIKVYRWVTTFGEWVLDSSETVSVSKVSKVRQNGDRIAVVVTAVTGTGTIKRAWKHVGDVA
jgi:hypothetical protein